MPAAADVRSDREIVASRTFDAPRDLVWKMWTEPAHMEKWWGPNGFTTTTQKVDVRPGGEWVFVMHGPDGTDYKNHIIFRELLKPERIAYSHVSGPVFDSTVTFSEDGGKTTVDVRMEFESAELRDRVAEQFGAVEGLHQHLGRLGEELRKITHAEFVISRVFDAPREVVFRAWADPNELQKWFGPKGASMFYSQGEVKPGGIYHYGMRVPGMGEVWGRWVFREIVPPERLLWVNSFSNKDGGISRHPMAPAWPAELLTTVTFDDEGGTTRVTVRWVPINAGEEERDTFIAAKDSMKGGWTGTFERLDEYLR
jgi:uncharacterized protein YndB with AHSA1/START domain